MERLRQACRTCAAALLLLTTSAVAVPLALEARWRGELLRHLDFLHLDADALDTDAFAEELASRSEAGASDEAVDAWMREETVRRILAFAPRDPTPDPAHGYRLPFDEVVPRGLVKEPPPDDRPALPHRFAFAMPVGEPVLGAAAGDVRLVVDGLLETEDETPYTGRGNRVVVLHQDGTLGVYEHLAAGIRVRVGQRVKRKEILGSVGPVRSGWPPHLHFHVARLGADGLPEPVAIRFYDGTPEGIVPEPGALLGQRPQANALLHVSFRGRVLGERQAIVLPAGAAAQLQVTLQPRSGPARDVTRDPATRYALQTPWNLSVSAGGEVRGQRSEGYVSAGEQSRIGLVTVIHREPARKLLGYADVVFAPEAQPAAAPR